MRRDVALPMSLPDLSQLPLNEHRALVLHRQARRAVAEAWEAWEAAAARYRQRLNAWIWEKMTQLNRMYKGPPEMLRLLAIDANRKLDAWLAAQAHEEAVFQQVRHMLPSEGEGSLRPPAGRVYERFPEDHGEKAFSDSDSDSDWDDD